uniref:Uncharacterized protein n=1 Tax=Neogobius melanostomus TaxID=47308 RepID=A0A8C6SXH7_9GOBI
LSLTSMILINKLSVPVLGGLPPSKAVSTSLIAGCFSRSKGFCRTNSGLASCSSSLCKSREKYSFVLSLIVINI